MTIARPASNIIASNFFSGTEIAVNTAAEVTFEHSLQIPRAYLWVGAALEFYYFGQFDAADAVTLQFRLLVGPRGGTAQVALLPGTVSVTPAASGVDFSFTGVVGIRNAYPEDIQLKAHGVLVHRLGGTDKVESDYGGNITIPTDESDLVLVPSIQFGSADNANGVTHRGFHWKVG